MELARLIDPDGKPIKAGGGRFNVRCPAHPDKSPSLTVWVDKNGKAAFNCHAGCEHHKILDAMPADARHAAEQTWGTKPVTILIPKRQHRPDPPIPPKSRSVEAEYSYLDETGQPVYLVRRYPGKKIRQFHYDDGAIAPGRPDTIPLVPYRLPDILAAKQAGDLIYIVEGEKDADTLAAHGLTATTNVGGAGKWTDSLDRWFGGANVVIIPDNDQPGHEHARNVLAHLDPVATVRLVELPDLADKGDVTDWLETHTAEQLEELVAQTAPTTDEQGEFKFLPGGAIFDYPDGPEAIWGNGQEVLWARGEPLMIYGPTGIGKTTVAGRILLALIGVAPPELLGYELRPLPEEQRILYIAADRPRQAMRSLRRMVNPADRDVLNRKLLIEGNRQLWASDKDPEMLYRACQQAHAGAIVIDSGKDVAAGPLKEETAAKALMDSIQICIANEIEVILLHHPRKADQQNVNREIDLDDVYGSTWLTAGSGSVLLVAGVAGQGLFTLTQLKAPAAFVQAMTVALVYETGALERRNTRDLVEWMKDWGPVTIRQATAFLYAVPEEQVTTDGGPYQKVKRKLEDMERQGEATRNQNKTPHTFTWVGLPEIRLP